VSAFGLGRLKETIKAAAKKRGQISFLRTVAKQLDEDILANSGRT